VRLERCSLREITGEVLGLLRPRCRHAHIELRWSPPDHPGFVKGDRGQLEQMVLNVVSNAIEAAGLKGWVEVGLRHEPGKKHLVLEVRDSGPGPPPEVSQRLFEPFVTGKPEGVGLGLAVARQVAEAHGGHISWHHDERGTCFRMKIPEHETDPDR
jgi:signal transduction histidine kinase